MSIFFFLELRFCKKQLARNKNKLEINPLFDLTPQNIDFVYGS